MKSLLLLLLPLSLFASSELPKPTFGDLNNNIRCIQGRYSCACCEEYFGDCKKGSLEMFAGKCVDLDALLREVRNSLYYDEDDAT